MSLSELGLQEMLAIRHVNEYPTMQYFGIPRHTQSMIANMILTEKFWKFQWKLHCGSVGNMPYRLKDRPLIWFNCHQTCWLSCTSIIVTNMRLQSFHVAITMTWCLKTKEIIEEKIFKKIFSEKFLQLTLLLLGGSDFGRGFSQYG